MSAPAPGTPLPWGLEDCGGFVFGCFIGTPTADICSMVDWPLEHAKEQRLNAEYIVTACNAFPELLEALDGLIEAFSTPDAGEVDRRLAMRDAHAVRAKARGDQP